MGMNKMIFNDYPYPSDGSERLYDDFDRSDDAHKRFISLPRHIREELEKRAQYSNMSDDLFGYDEDEYRY